MSANADPVTILPISESWDLLSSVPLGRLVTGVDGRPEIFAVNFVVQVKHYRCATTTFTSAAAVLLP